MSARSWLSAWLRSATELRALASDAYYVGVWQGSTAVAELVQIALITHALGLAEYGRLALVIAFATLVSQLFDVKIGTSATIFAGRELNRSPERAAGIMQFSVLVDAVTGVVGFAVVVAAAALAGSGAVGGAGFGLVVLYGLVLLASTVDDSSLTLLRLLDRFKLVALSTLLLEGLRIALVAGALAVYGSLEAIVLALLAERLIAGAVYAIMATVVFRRTQGRRLTGLALDSVHEERRAILAMVGHTTVVSYGRLTQVQLPTLLLGGLAGVTQVGIYKVGMAVATSVAKLADTANGAFLPRFARLWSGNRAEEARRLIWQSTMISVPVMSAAVVAVVLLRDPILHALGGGPEATLAGGVLIVGVIGYAVNGALFWNNGVLFATGRSAAMSKIWIGVAVAQLAMLPPLILAFDATGAALSVCLSSVLANVVTTVLARRALRSPAPSAAHDHAHVSRPVHNPPPQDRMSGSTPPGPHGAAAARLLARSLSGYLCGTHSGALSHRRGDRLAPPELARTHARLGVDVASDPVSLGLERWRPAAGAERLAAALRDELDDPAIIDLVLYGSQARGSVTRYSDVDAILVIEDDAARRPEALRKLRPRVVRAQRHMLEYQPMQHHGFEVATPTLLRVAGDALALPVAALGETATLFGRRLVAASEPSTADEARRRFQGFADQLLRVQRWPRHPWSLHGAISMFALAPALFAQALGEQVPKWQSFAIGSERFGEAWAPYEALREVREDWPEVRLGVLRPMLWVGANPWLAVEAWRRLPIDTPAQVRALLTARTLSDLHALVAMMQVEVLCDARA